MSKLKKMPKGRLHIMVMRSKGQIANFYISPLLLAGICVFSLAFSVASIYIMNRYVELMMEHKNLQAEHAQVDDDFKRLSNQQSYQASVMEEYANLVSAMTKADPQKGEDLEKAAAAAAAVAEGAARKAEEARQAAAEPAAAEMPPEAPEAPPAPGTPPAVEAPASKQAKLLDAFGDKLKVENDGQLFVSNFTLSGGRFTFTLENGAPDRGQAQGRLLVLCELKKSDGEAELKSFPETTLEKNPPDFSGGPSYSIKSSKRVEGRVALPAGASVAEVLILAQSRDGRIVMKTKIVPGR